MAETKPEPKPQGKLAELRKEFEDKPSKPDMEFKDVAEKLSKVRDRYLKVKSAADDTEDPNIEELRELRTRAWGEYRNTLTELIRRANLEID